jgi:flagellar biosynthesis component FlhA
LSRQEVKRLLDSMNESHPKLVEELVQHRWIAFA